MYGRREMERMEFEAKEEVTVMTVLRMAVSVLDAATDSPLTCPDGQVMNAVCREQLTCFVMPQCSNAKYG